MTQPALTEDQRTMVEDNLGLVRLYLHRRRTAPDEWDDTYQDAVIGLCRAVQLYDPTKGFRFSTYAWRWIRAGIQQGQGRRYGINYRHHLERQTTADWQPPLSIDAPLAGTDTTIADRLATHDNPADIDDPVILQRLLATCRRRIELDIIHAAADGRSMASVARAHGLTHQAVTVRWRRMRASAADRLVREDDVA